MQGITKVWDGWKQIAGRLRVTERTAREWAELHGLPVNVLMGSFQMEEADLQRWLASKRIPYSEHIKEVRSQRPPKAA
jgi:hypothetical protein